MSTRPPLDPRVAAYVESSYPHNLDYRVRRGALRPRWKLRRRLKRLLPLYTEPLESLLDLSSSKGYFVLEAAARSTCTRALGIDVHEPDLEASRAVAEHLGLERARFERSTLRELADRIDDLGGPFGTVLLVNTYPYLFYGSDRAESVAADHGELFELLARVTSDRLIFSNRVDLAALPRHIQARATDAGLEDGYDAPRIRAAAEAHFHVEPRRALGKIPLWLLSRR